MYRQLVPKVFECLDRLDMREQVQISSFDHQTLLELRARFQRVASAVLCSGRLARVAEHLELLDADAYHPSCSSFCDSTGLHAADSALDTATVIALRGAGKHINVWTCNEPAHMQALLAAGVTGLITDYLDRLAALISDPAWLPSCLCQQRARRLALAPKDRAPPGTRRRRCRRPGVRAP